MVRIWSQRDDVDAWGATPQGEGVARLDAYLGCLVLVYIFVRFDRMMSCDKFNLVEFCTTSLAERFPAVRNAFRMILTTRHR